MLSSEEKRRFLKALETDEEFRLAVAGLLGLGEILQELKDLRERMDRYIKLNEKRWRKWYKTWNKFLKEHEIRWEENRKRWEEQFRFNRWVQSALTEIRDALGGGFEYFAARVVEAVLRERGVECSVRVNVTLPVDGFKEVNLFCPEPLVVGEVSVAVRSVEEAEGLLEQLRRAVEAGEKLTSRRVYLKVLAVEYAPKDAADYLRKQSEKEEIYLILGREYDRLNIF